MTLLLALGCGTPEPPPPPPDILVVVLDTTRADHLATYGYERDNSYQLDALASSGVVFEQAYTAGTWTWPGHAELFTGEPPWISGAHHAEPGGPSPLGQLDATLPTLAEQLGAAGYDTVGHSTNKLLDPSLGMMRGFDDARKHRTDADTVAAVRATTAAEREAPLFLFVNVLVAHTPYFVIDGVPWSGAHRARIEAAADEPLASMRMNGPDGLAVDAAQMCGDRKCSQRYMNGDLELTDELTILTDLYDGGLVQTDNALKAIVQAWTGSGRQGVVIVTSDHGEFLGEHQMLLHGHVTLPPVLHIPLVVIGPGFPAGTRHAAPVQLGDVYDTVLAQAGLEANGWTLTDGLTGTPRPGPIQAAAWADPTVSGVDRITEPWRFHMEGGSWVALRGDEVAEGDASLAESARAIPLTPNTNAHDEDVMNTLRALGYVEEGG
ncbi:MAG: sulfatase-like hydrolase/transferase [Proteobacteria bacterium]|nr:sulfatase-like hydrolase/transferase [Pseudomonadota bacterium]MCP4919601.1 sulfatase-like hydrolase/transferase [Pseudomonadota bacterium]